MYLLVFFFLMQRRPPRSTRTDTLFPYTTLFRSRQMHCTLNLSTRPASTASQREPWLLDNFARFFIVDQQFRKLNREAGDRSEEHTSELQSLMRISYAVFCLKKKKKHRAD